MLIYGHNVKEQVLKSTFEKFVNYIIQYSYESEWWDYLLFGLLFMLLNFGEA